MPYKNKNKQRKAVRIAVQKHRAYKKTLKLKARNELSKTLGVNKIQRNLPATYKLLFGKRKKEK